MASTSAFSSNDDVISHTYTTPQLHVTDPRTYFQLQQCSDFINSGSYTNVVLQFPDELMSHATHVHNTIAPLCSASLYVLGDTSYGSCCVDEVAASHVDADAIIHFGQSCLSSVHRLPVLFVFGRDELDVEDFVGKLGALCVEEANDNVLLFYDVTFNHCAKELREQMALSHPNLVLTSIDAHGSCTVPNDDKENVDGNGDLSSSLQHCFGRSYIMRKDLTNYLVVFIGGETLLLRNLVFKFNRNKVLSYCPSRRSIRVENGSVNRSLMKRYYLIEKAKDANIVGIILGTLGVSRYKEMVARLKQVLQHAGKKFYTFVIGKINVAKMANFMEIDIFVLVACPENSLIDSKEFYKPILTPYEIEIACLESREWSGEYVTEFSEVLPGSKCHVPIEERSGSEEPEYSFITGQLRSSNKCGGNGGGGSCTDMIECNKDNQLQQYSAERYLSGRSWGGLEVNSGKTEVKAVEEGRSGIAMEYRNEETNRGVGEG